MLESSLLESVELRENVDACGPCAALVQRPAGGPANPDTTPVSVELAMGFEPMTPRLQGGSSTAELR